ncbi:helix-turn-helix transcriptional regulator [uncultured Mucilaginibacter sp.]|uniref:helix-turn-helix domain-containing protein n=1 Tax=uncultured Mucilaginibacter sp. TaxID=797541 RepID=UPI0025ED24BC|nr:helix-turn-helix transcriptional regulator [uncultured Mucilaginibacter sp.]
MKKQLVLLPKAQQVLNDLGENVKLARLRRKLSAAQVSERAGISRATLWQIEKGTPTVAMGAYFQVLFVMGLERDFLKLGADDELGRKLQDAGLLLKERAPKK